MPISVLLPAVEFDDDFLTVEFDDEFDDDFSLWVSLSRKIVATSNCSLKSHETLLKTNWYLRVEFKYFLMVRALIKM